MRQLPSPLVYLDRNMLQSGSPRRLGSRDQFHGTRICEADYDKLIVGQLASHVYFTTAADIIASSTSSQGSQRTTANPRRGASR